MSDTREVQTQTVTSTAPQTTTEWYLARMLEAIDRLTRAVDMLRTTIREKE